MRATSKILALALTAALQPAVAGVVSLDFEHETSVSKVGNFYAAQGVTFTGDAWSIGSNQNRCPGIASFSRTGSCGGLLLGVNPLDAPGTNASFTINFTKDIVDFSFVYGIVSISNVTIEVFDALDGKGHLLQSLNGLSGDACDTGVLSFCEPNWYSTSIKFSGVAKSIMVTGVDQGLMMDDLRFVTRDAPSGELPEPASMALAISALGALAWSRKRATR
ncbi:MULTISPECIES: hypothetical protein [unclassified Roseateles]|uniref:hypothetical protein n=1 Tax=unclassified Roseateles TaxID=2626991 RepID=UPI0006F62911|nr:MULTISPECIES: hypothetical protein [unclassified Roseateles]KQW51549.1 hypothetical protein ASC81_02625 [Pelomonas sp. Root405]KRA77782.1 hypothetical protein ASD88_02625 [Pelomonas sp. Root662]